jgi:hypothetical protein
MPTNGEHHDARGTPMSLQLLMCRWRVGRKVSRNVYAMLGGEASDRDVLIGQFDTGQLARAAVVAHDLWLKKHRC